MLLSALLGTLGSVSLMAQSTNVYSLNAVGYINVTLSAGYNLITCPLITSPDNTVGTLFNNSNHVWNGSSVDFFSPTTGYAGNTDSASARATNANGWANGGTNVAAPGVGFWFVSPVATNVTFVGTVPQGSITNTLVTGYNLVASAVPTSGDLCTNSITKLTNYNVGDSVDVYIPGTGYAGTVYQSSKRGTTGYNGNWGATGDPTTPNVYQAFFYVNSGPTVNWVENFSVNQ